MRDDVSVDCSGPEPSYAELTAYKYIWAGVLSVALFDIRSWMKRNGWRLDRIPTEEDIKARSRGKPPLDALSASNWLLSTSERPGGFLWTCELFGQNADRVLCAVLLKEP
jgi:hypothetical protein